MREMRIVVIQEEGRHARNRAYRECHSLCRALRHAGHQAFVWGLGHPNFQVLPDWNDFDAIVILEAYDDTGWLPNISSASHPIKVLWAIDEHCGRSSYYHRLFHANSMHIWLHSTRDFVLHNDDVWFPNCFDDELIYPLESSKRADVGFCGNVLNRHRHLELLARHFDFIADIFTIGDDMVRAVNSYRVAFNRNLANDVNYRSFEVIGCGIPLVTNWNAQYGDLGFEHGKNCMMYTSDDELIECVQELLGSSTRRETIGKAGYELSKRHTYRVRAKQLSQLIVARRGPRL